MSAGISLPRDPQPRALLCARGNPHFHGFRGRYASVAMASGTLVLQTAGAIASRTGKAEPHRAGHLGHAATAVAFGTNRVSAGFRSSAAAARRAGFLMVHGQPNLRALDRLPEIDTQPVLEIRAFFRGAGDSSAG